MFTSDSLHREPSRSEQLDRRARWRPGRAEKVKTNTKHIYALGIGRALAFLAILVPAQPLRAAEYGFQNFILGLATPLAGYTPPPGLYFRDEFFLYHGSFDAKGGLATYNIVANAGIVAWYPDWNVFGGSPGFAAVVPYIGVRNKFRFGAENTQSFHESTQSANALGDTEYCAILGWHEGEHHWNVMVTGFMPTGHNTPGVISITGLNRPAVDFRGAYTYLGLETGLELTGALGVTVNAMNDNTNYRTGAELHFEWAAEQHLPFGLYFGATGWIYQQLTGDTGLGAVDGAYIGRAFAVGPSVGYTIKAGPQEIKLSGRWYHEFLVKNRPSGDAIFASLDFRF
jgi:hypothetical protein